MSFKDTDKCKQPLMIKEGLLPKACPGMKVSKPHTTHHLHTVVTSYTTLTSQHIHHPCHHGYIRTHTTHHQHHINTQLIHMYVHVILYIRTYVSGNNSTSTCRDTGVHTTRKQFRPAIPDLHANDRAQPRYDK